MFHLSLNHHPTSFKLISSTPLPSLLLRSATSETVAVKHISSLVNRSESHLRTTYSTMSASASSDDVRTRGQQPVLASQRAKLEQQNHPTAANRTGRVAAFFPLGYKEGFTQWVREPINAS